MTDNHPYSVNAPSNSWYDSAFLIDWYLDQLPCDYSLESYFNLGSIVPFFKL